MRRLLAALLLVAGTAFGQDRMDSTPCRMDGTDCVPAAPTYDTLAAPTGCASGYVPIFLGSPVAMGCDAGLTYDAATDTLTLTGSYAPTLGAELLANPSFTNDLSSWTAGANWAWATGGAQHTAGATATLAQSVAVTSGQSYLVAFVISGRTAGTVAVSLGAVVLDAGGTTTFSETQAGIGIVAGASGSVALTITPTTDFDGTLDSVSITLISAAPAAYVVADGGGTVTAVRGSAAKSSQFDGVDAGRLNFGVNNSAQGFSALY